MVVVAISAGAAVGVVTRPAPSAEPSATPVPTVTPVPDTGPLVFKQPLASGCATDDAVWVVSDGGGIGRFDRLVQRWELIDSTLRSLVAVACSADSVVAVGAFGRVVTIDDLAKPIPADDVGLFNAYALASLPDGARVVGSDGAVQRPHPPVLVGGNGPTVHERVLAFGDAWFPNYGPDVVKRAGELRARAERPVDVMVIGVPAEASALESLVDAGFRRAVHWIPSAGREQVERALGGWESAIAELTGER